MEYPEKNELMAFSSYLRKTDFKLYERLSPLGCKTEDGRILMYSEATEGEHFTKEDWIKFIEYRRTFRELAK